MSQVLGFPSGIVLSLVVSRAQSRDQLSGVLGGVDGEGLGKDEQGVGEFANGQLFLGSEVGGEGLEMNGEGCLDTAATRNDRVAFEDTLDHAERIVNGAVHLIQHVVIGAAEEEGDCLGGFAPTDHSDGVIRNALLEDLRRRAKACGVEGLVTLHIRQRDNNRGTGGTSNALEVILFHAADGQDAGLNKVLEGHIINTLRGEDHIGTGCEDLLDPLLSNIQLTSANLLQLSGIGDENLHTHHETSLLKVHVKTGDFRIDDATGHTLSGTGKVEGIAVEETAFTGALTVGFEDADGLYRVADTLRNLINTLDSTDGINDQLGEKVAFNTNNFGGHRGLGSVQEALVINVFGADRKFAVNEFARLAHRLSETINNICRMKLITNKLICSLQKLRSKNNNGCSSITNFGILKLSKFDKDLSSRVFDLKKFKNSSAIIGNSNVPNIIDKHLIKTHGSQRALNNISDSRDGSDVLSTHILTTLTFTVKLEARTSSHSNRHF
mmetsp:Transcript_1258/g.1854  ORF Transcript_1258/g.1854 Transcript_1258/m.1854 type:complete len:496 (-) Transcript_1258:108-1595(-)